MYNICAQSIARIFLYCSSAIKSCSLFTKVFKAMYCAGECDNLQWGPFEVYFPNGTSAVNLTINITDDDFHEGDESFYLVIDDNLPDRVFLNDPYRTTIIIRDDEKSKQFLLSNLYCCSHLISSI